MRKRKLKRQVKNIIISITSILLYSAIPNNFNVLAETDTANDGTNTNTANDSAEVQLINNENNTNIDSLLINHSDIQNENNTDLNSILMHANGMLADTSKTNKDVYIINSSDLDSNKLENTILQRNSLENTNSSLSYDDIKNSIIDINVKNNKLNVLQTATAKINVPSTDKDGNTINNNITKDIIVVNQQDYKPTILLTENEVTIDNGTNFEPMDYISNMIDYSGKMPMLTIDGTVDTSTDGTYQITYKVNDIKGNSNSASLTVNVKTPEEIIKAREEAKKKEEAAKAAEEARKRAEEERKAVAERIASARQNEANYYSGEGTDIGNSIANMAKSWIGVGIYVSGGTNPATGTDCSGFVQYIYAQAGIYLPRTSYAQAYAGYQISAEEAKPGDLVIWSNHSAIYTGNGMDVSALNPYVGIKEKTVEGTYGSGYFMGYYRIPGVNY